MATKLIDLIESVNADDLPTNEFTIEDKDPMVILGKLNEVIANLEALNSTINASDSKANEALQRAIQAVADATQALSVANGIDAKATQALANATEAVGTANTALSASNTALSTANTAISTANTALSSANSAVETAESAETKADTAITTANGAKTTAEGIDAKATTALSNSQTAVSTANTAETTAQEALDQVVAGLGTKVYRDTQLLTSLDIKPIEEEIANNTTNITNLSNNKVDKVAGKQLSTEDFTTEEKTKLAGLNNYDDTQVQADITALQGNITAEAQVRANADNALQQQITANANAIVGKQDTLTFDNTPTQNSNNPVTSGGVYNAINKKWLFTGSLKNDSATFVNDCIFDFELPYTGTYSYSWLTNKNGSNGNGGLQMGVFNNYSNLVNKNTGGWFASPSNGWKWNVVTEARQDLKTGTFSGVAGEHLLIFSGNGSEKSTTKAFTLKLSI